MPAPFKLKPVIYQGATFDDVLTWKSAGVPVDLTGCTARMQVREQIDSPSVLLSLTTENGGIVLGGTSGTVSIHMSAVDTAAITWTAGVFDLEIIFADGVTVRRLLSGSISVSPEVTRD